MTLSQTSSSSYTSLRVRNYNISSDFISILGDGNLSKISLNVCRLRVIHGEKQFDYIEWKSQFFNCKCEYLDKNGFSQKPAKRFQSKGFFCDYTKKSAIEKLNIRSLSIAWMDDGSLSINGDGRLYSFANDFSLINYLNA